MIRESRQVLFTVEFRRKLASLTQPEREEWLASLAGRARRAGGIAGSEVAQELREVARACRAPMVETIHKQLGPFDPIHLRALLEVPRERFVRLEDIERSAEDTPLPLDEIGEATISAPHAYLLSFRLVELSAGDALIELGAGSGYGAALAAYVVEREGHVVTFEIDPALAEWAARSVSDEPNVAVVQGDAISSAGQWAGATKIVVTFALDAIPESWVDALPEGGKLVAPVGPRGQDQQLLLVSRRDGAISVSRHGAVRYVKNRSAR